MATASFDGTARVFVMDTDELRAALLVRMPRPLTEAEWRRYGGRPADL